TPTSTVGAAATGTATKTATPTATRTQTATSTSTAAATSTTPSSLNGSVLFQGRGPAGDPRWSVPLSVKFFPAGTNIVTLSAAPTTSTTGGFTVNTIPPGTYDV